MTMAVPPEIRRRNVWLLVGLIAFAIALCAVCLWWMEGIARKRASGTAEPPRTSFVLPTDPPCLT